MQITVVGAGAIGGTVGAYLARAGHPLLFCDTDLAHVAAINQHGLHIRGWAEEFTIKAPAVTPAALQGPLDLVLLAVKAQYTKEAIATITPLLSEQGLVVSLQNGLNEQVIAEYIGAERTIGCLVNFSADYLEPGLIHYGGPGALKLGELDGTISPRLSQLQTLLSAWGHVELTNNIWGYLWGKLGYANMLYATALADASMADVIDRYRELMIALASEVYQVAEQHGIRPEAFDGVEPSLYYPVEQRNPALLQQSLDALVERRKRDQKQRSGIWRDIMVRRRRTEIDQQLGPVVLHGAAVGLKLPLTKLLIEQIHTLEQGHSQPDWAHLDRLEQLRRSISIEHP